MRFLFLLFIVMPILETWLLIQVGSQIGALPTIGLVLLTATIGFQLLRRQGFETLWRGHRKLEEGQLPAGEIVEGIILAVSGALLLTPGFCTDAIGFAGLLPPLRAVAVRLLLKRVVVTGMYSQSSFQYRSGDGFGHDNSGDTIDGEYWEPDRDRLK